MKVLHLIGPALDSDARPTGKDYFLAKVWVESNRIRVASSDADIERDVWAYIHAHLGTDAIASLRTERAVGKNRARYVMTTATPRQPGDPDFLEAVRDLYVYSHLRVGKYAVAGLACKIVDE